MSDDGEILPPSPDDRPSASVSPIGVSFKLPPGEDGKILTSLDPYSHREGCNHQTVYRTDGQGLNGRIVEIGYRFRVGETEVECGNCRTKLDPMWVLKQLAGRESAYHRKREIAQEEMKRLNERTRTRCEHCGRQTRISRAKPKPKR